MKNRWKLVMALLLSAGVVNAAYVTIGNAGNAADATTGYGAVAYSYKISATEVTIAEFNASGAGSGGEDYWNSVGTAAPASYVSLYEAMKYCNFITSGDVNSGYYNSGDAGATYQANALSHDAYAAANGLTYFVPTEDEWYKAAYYDASGAGGYSLYANGTSTAPVAGTDANYSGSTAWVVGTGTEEQNETDDMMGNVWEWMEDSAGVIRGGGYSVSEVTLRSSNRVDAFSPSDEVNYIGFRPVEVVPEPATMGLLGIGGAIVFLSRLKRRFYSL